MNRSTGQFLKGYSTVVDVICPRANNEVKAAMSRTDAEALNRDGAKVALDFGRAVKYVIDYDNGVLPLLRDSKPNVDVAHRLVKLSSGRVLSVQTKKRSPMPSNEVVKRIATDLLEKIQQSDQISAELKRDFTCGLKSIKVVVKSGSWRVHLGSSNVDESYPKK